MSKATQTLKWLDTQRARIDSDDGAAFEEVELLRMMLNGASGTGGVFSAAYRTKLSAYVPSLTERAEAREYAHYVMFASDFGLDPVTHPQPVNALLDEAVVAHQHDLDTLGELLIACQLLGHLSTATQAAKAVFDAEWVLVPRTFENYHPILVGGILYALRGE